MKQVRALPTLLALAGCTAIGDSPAPAPPLPGMTAVDHLIEPGEQHFSRLWKLTSGGENAEAYWSFDDARLCLQRRQESRGIDCDRIFVTSPETGELVALTDGTGATTCSFFLPGDREVIYASTRGWSQGCPPPIDPSQGYVWGIWPEHDLWVRDVTDGALRRLTYLWGYDAEATVSPLGDRMVFTSTRSGDLELWTADLDGSALQQVTRQLGYDGGAFFSHDGTKLVFRSTEFAPGAEGEAERANYVKLLENWRVRPHSMEVHVIGVDGSDRRQVTRLGGANWCPYFFPDDERILFSTNHHDADMSDGINFDLFAIDEDGGDLERVTTYAGFDAFPMFSRDGRYLAFSSNRGGEQAGETNVFVAEWK